MGNDFSADRADAVVVGGGTVGAWCAWFLKRSGLRRVVLLEAATLGSGASSRAAGMVRAQGGVDSAVRLGLWTRDFYADQHRHLAIDSGFVAQGYCIPCFTGAEVAGAQQRVTMQQSMGVDVDWLEPDEFDRRNPIVAPGRTYGSSFSPGDGYIDPVRNVLAYTAALVSSGVEVQERTAVTGLDCAGGEVRAALTTQGSIGTQRVVLAAGAGLAALGRMIGVRIPCGGVRHQVVVTAPHPDLHPVRCPMVFDVAAGIYWRPEEGGLLWGMSNPDEAPGAATSIDEAYLATMRARLADVVPVTARLGTRKSWAATIEFTPDHLPILGPVLTAEGAIAGTVIAGAAGHGMMWGPAVARAAADLALTGRTEIVDVVQLGLDRFDPAGRSRVAADPIALPFPDRTDS